MYGKNNIASIPNKMRLEQQHGMNVLINLIIQQYFVDFRCSIFFSDKENHLESFGNLSQINIRVENDDIHPELFFSYFGCDGIIVHTKNPVTVFRKFETEIRQHMERWPKRRFLIIESKNTSEGVTDIFNTREIFHVPDVVVVERDRENDHKLLLWINRYVGEKNNNDKVLIDIWNMDNDNGNFEYGNELYPNKLLDQKKRPLRIGTIQYEPYSIIVNSSPKESKGSEMMGALAFAEKYKMEPVFVLNPSEYWGDIFDNWTGDGWDGYGILGNLAGDKTDIGFAALYMWEQYYHYLDLSNMIIRVGATLLVPAPRLLPAWLTPIYSYSNKMWLAVGISFVVCITSMFYIKYLKTKILKYKSRRHMDTDNLQLLDSSVFSILKMFVLQSITQTELPEGINGQFFVAMIFILNLFLTSIYTSGLSSIMTIPLYEKPIDTFYQFYQSDLYWGALGDAWTFSLKEANDSVIDEIVRRFRVHSEEELRELSIMHNFAYIFERLPSHNFAIGRFIKGDVIDSFHVMRDDFYYGMCCYMLRKSSAITPILNDFILRVVEAGLPYYWETEGALLYMDSTVQKAMRYDQSRQTVQKLKFKNVEGAFAILFIGYSVSLVVLVAELLVRYRKNKRKEHISLLI